MTASFFAAGLPKGQPRAKAVRFGNRARVYDPGTADSWKAAVKLASKEAGVSGLHTTHPIALKLAFIFPRPKSHHKGGDFAKPVKDAAPRCHVAKPDTDNAAKAVMDALTDCGVWRDDSQVCALSVTKTYGLPSGCRITIEESIQ